MKKRAGNLILVQLISVIGILCLTALFSRQGVIEEIPQIFSYLFDAVALVLLLIIALPSMLVHGIWRDFFRVFQLGKKDRHFSLCEIKRTLLAIKLLQKQIIYGTIMVVGIYTIVILRNLDELSMIGPNMSVDFISLLYMAIVLLFIEPLKVYVQRYLEDYLAEEED
ncbi:MAG: hypothetical protein J1E62_02545 [Lachnospiraceae bacterium]|nr:hypothetical protein [Lachnospiraceae bacterium]